MWPKLTMAVAVHAVRLGRPADPATDESSFDDNYQVSWSTVMWKCEVLLIYNCYSIFHRYKPAVVYLEFQGSCFVVFGSDETAKKFLDTPDVKYGDVTLLREYRSLPDITLYICKLICWHNGMAADCCHAAHFCHRPLSPWVVCDAWSIWCHISRRISLHFGWYKILPLMIEACMPIVVPWQLDG